MSEWIINTTDTNFDGDVLRAETPVLVDFWGEWCGPCKAMVPMLEQLADGYAGRLRIAKVELDKNQRTAIAYGVRSAPTLLLFNHGKVQATQIGMASKSQLTRMVDALL